jgi:hypothetical protein
VLIIREEEDLETQADRTYLFGIQHAARTFRISAHGDFLFSRGPDIVYCIAPVVNRRPKMRSVDAKENPFRPASVV